MEHKLTADELSALVTRVFEPGQSDERLGVIVDMPDQNTPDKPARSANKGPTTIATANDKPILMSIKAIALAR